MTAMTLRAADSSVTFALADGARTQRLVLGGRSLAVPDTGAGELWWGAFVMAPWTSTLRDARFALDGRTIRLPADHPPNAEHGVARKAVWRQQGRALVCDLADGWPLGGWARMTPVLRPSQLDLRLEVQAGDQAMPAALGWHPWFVRWIEGVEVQLRLPPEILVQDRGPDGIPTGRWRTGPGGSVWDDCLRFPGPITLVWPGIGRLEVSWSSDFVTVFSTHPQGICVEPVTSPAEQLDRLLLPGERLSLDLSLRWYAAT